MSNQITTSFSKQFGSSVMMLAQQKSSKLRGYVRNESLTGEEAFFDQVGSVNMQSIQTRHEEMKYAQVPHRRRRVAATPRYVADLIDRADQVRTLNDTQNAYVQSFAASIGREMDQTILDAVEAAAKTGKAGNTNVAFGAGTDSSMTVANDIENSGSPAALTVHKLRRGSRLLNEQDVEEDDRTIVMHPVQLEALLGETEATSSDFNTVKALVNGEINSFVGFRFVTSSLMPKDKVYFWHKQGMLLGVQQEPMFRITEAEKNHFSTQIYASVDIGATRMEEKRVGLINVLDPSA